VHQEISHEKTSLRIDRAKVTEAQQVLGTETIVDTVDAALREVIDLARRRRVMDRVRRDGGLGPRPSELRRLRRR
jgi:Arc/MetJ family transcription regulator